MALHGGGHHGGGHHHGGGGFRGPRGGGYFAPPSGYAYPYDYYEPTYVPVFIVEDEEDRRKKEEERLLLEALRKKVAKKAAAGLGIFSPLRGTSERGAVIASSGRSNIPGFGFSGPPMPMMPMQQMAPVPGASRSSTDVRSPTSTRTEVRSPTSTRTEVRSPTSTSTEAYTRGNFTATVTGGAGAGATTTVNILPPPPPPPEATAMPVSGLGIFSFPPREPFAFHRRRPAMHGLGAVTFGNKTYDQTVYDAQVYLNSVLKSRGYLAIGTDGKLGAATCGACAWLMQGGASDYDKGIYFDMNTVPQAVYQVWNVCASSTQTPPSPVTAAAKTSSYEVAITANANTSLNTEAVKEAQTALNIALAAAGMCAIGVDGKAGAETCGAQTWLIANAGGDGLTQAQRDAISLKCSTSAKTVPHTCGSAQVVPSPGPAPLPPAPPPAPIVKPPVSTAAMVMGVGIAAAAAAGLYVYFKNR